MAINSPKTIPASSLTSARVKPSWVAASDRAGAEDDGDRRSGVHLASLNSMSARNNRLRLRKGVSQKEHFLRELLFQHVVGKRKESRVER